MYIYNTLFKSKLVYVFRDALKIAQILFNSFYTTYNLWKFDYVEFKNFNIHWIYTKYFKYILRIFYIIINIRYLHLTVRCKNEKVENTYYLSW